MLRLVVSALLLGCAGEAVSIGANPFRRDVPSAGGSPGFAGGGNNDAGFTGGVKATAGGTANAGSGGIALGGSGGIALGGSGGIALGGSGGGAAIVPVVGCAQQLASGDSHLCVMYDDGHVACLGDNSTGQLGEPIGTSSSGLRTIPDAKATLIAAGANHNCIVTSRGVECWGDNSVLQLGTMTPDTFSATPVLTQPKASAGPTMQLVAGSYSTCSLDNLMHASCWGLFGAGSSTYEVPTPMPKIGLEPGQFLVAGSYTLRFVQTDRLFDVPGPGDERREPAVVRGASAGLTTDAIAVGHDCILKRSGTVWCRTDFLDPYTAVTELGTDLVEVKVGHGFTCVRSQLGEVRCLGASERGQLGSLPLPTTGRSVVAVPVGTGAVGLSLGLSHACALMQDRSVRCWGALGDVAFGARPTTISQPDPDAACAPSEQRFWGEVEPVSRPADEYADSALAWAQEKCRISGLPFEACVRDETPVLNGCLQSIGANDQDYSNCAGGEFWRAASCVAASDGDSSNIEKCRPNLDACGYPPGVVGSCARNQLLCDYNASPRIEVLAEQVCDGTVECPNGFDEANCQPDSDVFVCGSGTTIPLAAISAGEIVCGDGTGL